tara:strand:- start:2143 stop:2961 length:819 start_codon:yes stop_codon:yes gene_type:complete
MNLDDITIIITTYKSAKKVKFCLNSIKEKCSVIIIENSKDLNLKKDLENNYKKLRCIIPNENLGYGKANNLGLKEVKTKYALILNPDTTLENDTLEKFLIRAKNLDFAIISPTILENQNNKDLVEVKNVKGFAMFLNLFKFEKINFFDENIFLYFEEIDLCKRILVNKEKIFLDNNIKINHEGAKSVDEIYQDEIEFNRNWHWMWSTFYFHKKYKGFFISLLIVFPYLLTAFLRVFLYLLLFNKRKRKIYSQRISGLINSILGKKSWYRPNI